jgi:hypothetical protein
MAMTERKIIEIGKPCRGNTGDWGRIIVYEVDGPLGPTPVVDWESLPEPLDVRMLLALAVALSRPHAYLRDDPEPGDLVVETSWMRRGPDPDAIGWLVSHGEAAYADDGSGPTREVWDVTPLSGAPGLDGRPYQRWENAQFRKVRTELVEQLGLRPPDGWHSDFALKPSEEEP